MKQVKVKLFSFDELSDDVRKKIVDKSCYDIAGDIMDLYGDEYICSLNEFENLLNIKVNFEISYCGKHYSWRWANEPCMGSWLGKELCAEEICGKYLRRWLNNNFLDSVIKHKRFIKYDAGYNNETKRWNKRRISRITFDSIDSCPMTGMCYDSDLLIPVRDCLAKPIPNTYSLNDLVDDCLYRFFKFWEEEYEYWYENKDNCIEEHIRINSDGVLYFEDGREFHGIYEEAA